LGGTGERDWEQAGWKTEEGRTKSLEEEGGQRWGGCNSLERERYIKQQGSLLSAHCSNRPLFCSFHVHVHAGP